MTEGDSQVHILPVAHGCALLGRATDTTPKSQGLCVFVTLMQMEILKDEEDSGVDSFTFTQDTHRHGAVPVRKSNNSGKLMEKLGNSWKFTPVSSSSAGTIKYGLFLLFCLVF